MPYTVTFGPYAESSFLYAYCTYAHLLLYILQVGMMAISNTEALLLPLLLLAQVLLAISGPAMRHHMLHDTMTASLKHTSEQPISRRYIRL